MPLVRIDIRRNADPAFGRKIGAIVYQTMTDTINVPAKDNFQVITEHDGNGLIYDPSYLDIPRTDGFVLIQITLNAGRTVEMKQVFYKTLAEHLHAQLGIRKEDVFIGLMETAKDNFS